MRSVHWNPLANNMQTSKTLDKKIRVGVLVDSGQPNAFVKLLTKQLVAAQENYDVTIIRIAESGENGKKSGFQFFRYIRKLESIVFEKGIDGDDYNDLLENATKIEVRSVSTKLVELSDDDIQKIRSYNLDIILRCNKGILTGKILTEAAQRGVISTHHGDETKYRGGPPGFWEVLRKEYFSGFIIQILTEELDNGKILARGKIKTRPPFIRNQLNLYRASIDPLLSAIDEPPNGPVIHKSPIYVGPIYKNPKNFMVLKYLYVVSAWVAVNFYRRLFALDWQWRVHYSTSPNDRLGPFRTIEVPKGHFYADPSVFIDDDKKWLVFEDLNRADGFGKISMYSLNTGEKQVDVLKNQDHHSFPRIFKYEASTFMTVEANEKNGLQVYKFEAETGAWKPLPRVLKAHKIIDPLTFSTNGKTYIHVNIVEAGDEVTSSRVYEFQIESDEIHLEPLEYRQSASKDERNAGVLCNSQGLFRVTQISERDTYGKSIKIYRISIVGSKYSEYELFAQDDYPRSDFEAMHTLNMVDGIKVFDSAIIASY